MPDIIDPQKVYVDGVFLEDNALAQLLIRGGLFIFFKEEEGLRVEVNCNDLFVWACAMSLPIESEEDLKDLYDEVAGDERWGMVRWACKKVKEKPMHGWIEMMKQTNSWDEEMEALAPNSYDKMLENEEKSNA